ncbi:MAG: arylsulfatase [Planctomycetes bacterium]|nr:arylsulfatase [Planctomycetota bacterium]
MKALLTLLLPTMLWAQAQPPNIVVVFCDDLGYGDLGCYGHPTIRTPHLDRMAREGTRLTEFYVGASVCTPSRAALLTARLPIRSGMCSDKRRVLFPRSKGGLPASEITLAESLKAAGYATGCFGKWHLGHRKPFLPTRHGFDTYYGIPYSNDMDRVRGSPKGRASFNDPKSEYWNVPLMKDEEIVERPADQTTITRRYADAALAFMSESTQAKKPFFVYLANSMPHVPLFASDAHRGKSPRGLYGDVIEEIDANVGRVLDFIRSNESTAKNTLVFFTSDNGPWLPYGLHGGSAGLLRAGKGTTFEGGLRVPGIAWWPGKIPAGRVTAGMATTMDLHVTALELAGATIPDDRTLDGQDIQGFLRGGSSPRTTVLYYRGATLYAVRVGPWKAHFITHGAYGSGPKRTVHDVPKLFHLEHDPSEQHEVGKKHPDVIAKLRKIAATHRASVEAPPSQLELR